MKKLMILASVLMVAGMSVMTQAKELVFSDDVHKLYENQITTDLLTNENETLEVSIDRHVKEMDEFLGQVKDEIKRNEKFRALLPSYLMKAVGVIAVNGLAVATVFTGLGLCFLYLSHHSPNDLDLLIHGICATTTGFFSMISLGGISYLGLKYGFKHAKYHEEYGKYLQDLLDRGNQILSELNVIKENSVLVA